MSLLSSVRKDKQEPAADDGEFVSRAEEASNTVRNRTRRKASKPAAQANDPVLPEKKRARRRLGGAIALVLAAVIGLPMVLDSEPKPIAEDIAIQSPSRDKVPALNGGQAAAPAKQTGNVVDQDAPDAAGGVVTLLVEWDGSPEATADLIELLVKAGAGLAAFSSTTNDLEELFLKIATA